MADGCALKSHRDVEGRKVFQLHAPDGTVEAVTWSVVEDLQEGRLIDSNKKFPAATYWLTEKGREVLAALNPSH